MNEIQKIIPGFRTNASAAYLGIRNSTSTASSSKVLSRLPSSITDTLYKVKFDANLG